MVEDRELSHSEQNAKAGLESIKEMVAALECDYDRLEELRDERDALAEAVTDAEDDDERSTATHALEDWDAENAEELRDLIEAAGECESREDAETRIHEDPLSIEVRSDWYCLGSDEESKEPTEFRILLTTGGPALRIIGELRNGEPHSARLEHQDWGTPWTEWRTTRDEEEILLTYCRCFCFEH